MPVDTQIRPVGASTANGVVDIMSLNNEINANESIVTAMVGGASVEVDGPDVVVAFKAVLSPAEVAAFDAVLLAHQGIGTVEPTTVQEVSIKGVNTINGRLDTAIFPPAVSRKNLFTHDFTDPTTWYTSAEKIVDEPMFLNTEGLGTRVYDIDVTQWDREVCVIQAQNAKIFGEDTLLAPDGETYAPVLTVDGNVMTPKTIENLTDFDYEIDFSSERFTGDTRPRRGGRVEFRDEPPDGSEIRLTFYRATDSRFFIRPAPGKVLELDSVEIQFSTNVSVRDTMIFQPYGRFDGLSPEQQAYLTANVFGGVTPPGDTRVPYGNPTVYKSMRDFIREANGNHPIIPPSGAPQDIINSRDLRYGTLTYPWNYQSVITLESSKGMEIEIRLKNDLPYYGEFGDATFYCYSEDEGSVAE